MRRGESKEPRGHEPKRTCIDKMTGLYRKEQLGEGQPSPVPRLENLGKGWGVLGTGLAERMAATVCFDMLISNMVCFPPEA